VTIVHFSPAAVSVVFFSDVDGKEERPQNNLKRKRKSPPKYSEF
jgi:hypothetical protein